MFPLCFDVWLPLDTFFSLLSKNIISSQSRLKDPFSSQIDMLSVSATKISTLLVPILNSGV